MKKYWHCVVEVDIPGGEMPQGSDLPMRVAVGQGAKIVHSRSQVLDCWSGWGLSRAGALRVVDESCKECNCVSDEDVIRRDGQLKK